MSIPSLSALIAGETATNADSSIIISYTSEHDCECHRTFPITAAVAATNMMYELTARRLNFYVSHVPATADSLLN